MESTMHVPEGCVIFDETTQPDCGWYARDEEEARRFFSGQDLPESALWLTNVSYELGREVFQALPEGFCTHDYLREDLAEFDPAIAKVEAKYGPNRAGDIPHSLACIDKAKTLLGYAPEFSVKRGLQAATGWYFENLKFS